jgi:hypothetical protein
MSKLNKCNYGSLPFKGNFVDFEPLLVQMECWDQYYERNLAEQPAVKMKNDIQLPKTTIGESPVEEKRLRGVLKRGPDSFAVRVSIPDANDQAHIHHCDDWARLSLNRRSHQ